jgi:peptidoglycan/xylan/chitin deacetylase (PgdA/CDA1 family)
MMLLSISFDDMPQEDAQIADLMFKYDLEDNTVFYWPVMPQLVNEANHRSSLNYQQRYEISRFFEIGSHTLTHRLLTRIPFDEAKYEIVHSREELQTLYGQPIDKLAWPRGYTRPVLEAAAKEAGYASARGVLVGVLQDNPDELFNQHTTVHVGFDRKEYNGKTWFEYALDKLEEAKNVPNAVYSIFGHGWELAAYPKGFQLIEELIRLLPG